MPVHIDIATHTDALPEKLDIALLAKDAVEHSLAALEMADAMGELSIVVTDDTEIQDLNAQWRNKNKATNVLSFPAAQLAVGDRPGPLLGDIVLSVETTSREAGEAGIGVDNHFIHLIVHGLLHLLGYDHENDADADKMESLEKVILEQMGIKDPYTVQVADS